MADGFQGGEELYKGGAREQDPKRLAEIVAQYQKIIDANKQLDKLSKAQSKSLAAQEKNLDRLQKRLIAVRARAVDPLANAMGSLTQRLVGSSGVNQAITRFTGASVGALFNVDRLNNTVSIFGRTLSMSATSLIRYTGALQVVIGLTLKYLEFQDEAQRRQAALMKSFARTDISIGASYRLTAEGLRTAGDAGKKASEALQEALSRGRMRDAGQFLEGNAKEATQEFNKLLHLATGTGAKIPELVTRLSESFAIREQTTIVDELEKIAMLAIKSGAPVNQLAEMVFNLGEKFTYLGMTVAESRAMVMEFADAVGKRGLMPAVGMAVASQAADEFQTAAGVPGVGRTAWALGNQFENLPENLQQLLGGEEFARANVYDQMERLYELTPGQYSAVKAVAGYEQVQQIREQHGTPAARVAARSITGLELRTLEEYFEKATPGVVTADEAAAALEKLIEETERSQITSADVRDSIEKQREELSQHLKTIADLQVKWYDVVKATWEDTKSAFAEFQENVKDAESIPEGVAITAREANFLPPEEMVQVGASLPYGGGMIMSGLIELIDKMFSTPADSDLPARVGGQRHGPPAPRTVYNGESYDEDGNSYNVTITKNPAPQGTASRPQINRAAE